MYCVDPHICEHRFYIHLLSLDNLVLTRTGLISVLTTTLPSTHNAITLKDKNLIFQRPVWFFFSWCFCSASTFLFPAEVHFPDFADDKTTIKLQVKQLSSVGNWSVCVSIYYDVIPANSSMALSAALSWCKDTVMSVISVLCCDLPCVPLWWTIGQVSGWRPDYSRSVNS